MRKQPKTIKMIEVETEKHTAQPELLRVEGWLARIGPWGRKTQAPPLRYCACGRPLRTWVGAARGTCADCEGLRR